MQDFLYSVATFFLLGLGIFCIGHFSNRNNLGYSVFGWIIKQALTNEMWRCIRNSKQNTLAFISLIAILISGGLVVIFTFSPMRQNPLIMGLITIFTTIFCVVLINSVIFFRWLPYNKSIRRATQTRFSNNFVANQEHDGFVIVRYRCVLSNLYLVDCIDLLVRGYALTQKPWKIYCCSTKESFMEVYKDPNVVGLWIIGHGRKNRLAFDQNNLEYRELPKNVRRKEFIAQLTCNLGPGPSIIEINHPRHSFISNFLRIAMQNRCFIINTLDLHEP